ncbi:hypothetical protein RB594_008236 [Gaeumannomyces avenae]
MSLLKGFIGSLKDFLSPEIHGRLQAALQKAGKVPDKTDGTTDDEVDDQTDDQTDNQTDDETDGQTDNQTDDETDGQTDDHSPNPSDISELIDAVLSRGNVPTQDVATLRLVQVLVDKSANAEERLQVPSWAIAKMGKTMSRDSLVSLVFPREKLDSYFPESNAPISPGVTKASAEALRRRTWAAEPMLVMSLLLREQKWPVIKRPKYERVPARTAGLAARLLQVLSRDASLNIAGGTAVEGEILAGLKAKIDEDNKEAAEAGKKDKAIAQPSEKEFRELLEFVRCITCLAPLVQEPEDVLRLWVAKYRSVRRVASEFLQDDFVKKMVGAGSLQQNAAAIHTTARRIDCWNEQLWLNLMNAQRKDGVPIEPRKAGENSGVPAKSSRAMMNLTDIFRLEDASCEACCSVTSLSAYFADLMSFLESKSVPGSAKSLLDLLTERRPDLRELELSCANAMTLIPYISLVTETLESFVRYISVPGAFDKVPAGVTPPIRIAAHNTSREDAEAVELAADGTHAPVHEPGNTDVELYSKIISQQMFPFNRFPYNQGHDTAVQILGSFGIKMDELSEVFAAPRKVLLDLAVTKPPADETARRGLQRGVGEVLERHQAAEQLRMNQSEFTAVTGETFFPGWFADLATGLATKPPGIARGCPWAVEALWGYKDLEAMQDREQGLGLSFIKRQLMPRAGIEFQDVLDLTKTQCFGQDLVIVSRDGSRTFDGTLENLRLLSGASSPPFTAVGPDVAFRLQAFLRLKAKLGWTAKELDAAVYSLRRLELDSSPGWKGDRGIFSISPFVVKSIAALVKLGSLLGVHPATLLPLWGDLDAFRENSAVFRLLSRSMVSTLFPALVSSEGGANSKQPFTVHTGASEFCRALKWPVELFDDLAAAAGIKGEAQDGALDVPTFSKLYRYRLLCSLLGINPKDAATFFCIFLDRGPGKDHPLQHPSAMLAAVRDWKVLADSGWTVQSLVAVLEGPEAVKPHEHAPSSGPRQGLALLSAITKGGLEMRKALPLLYAERQAHGQVSAEQAASCIAQVFDAEMSRDVVEFIEGRWECSEAMSFANLEGLQQVLKLAKTFPEKVTITVGGKGTDGSFQAQLRLTGRLLSAERAALDEIVTTIPSLKEAVEILHKRSTQPCEPIRRRFSPSEDQIAKSPALNYLLQGKEPLENFGNDASIDCSRLAFVEMARPVIIHEYLEEVIVKACKELIPDLEASMVSVLLTKIVKVNAAGSGAAQETPLTMLQALADPGPDGNGQDVRAETDIFFVPPAAGAYTFSCSTASAAKDSAPKLEINGIELPFDSEKKTWSSFSLSAGHPHRLTGSLAVRELLWTTPKSPVPRALPMEFVTPAAKSLKVAGIQQAIVRVGQVCAEMGLSADEIEALQKGLPTSNRILSLDFNKPTMNDLVKLKKYRDLCEAVARRMKPVPEESNRIIDLFAWLSRVPETVATGEITEKISLCTGWESGRLLEAMTQKFPTTGSEGHAPIPIRGLDDILEIRDMMDLDERLSRAAGRDFGISMATLFRLAQPSAALTPQRQDEQAIANLQSRLSSAQSARANAGLMENRRPALLAYLLQHDVVRDKFGVEDADGLFQHLLIDVQMGPQLQTSRIKLAIGIIQLFVQRCLMGDEKAVPKGALRREDWQWRSQHDIWEAHRKLFLYPENWLDASLRDDKSPLFDELEASLMQKGLSMETFADSIKAYICSLNDISTLEIVAYVHDNQAGTAAADTFHIFGRTRSSPYTFYYRSLTVNYKPYGRFWRPWVKMDMDIPSTETEWQGKRVATTGTYLVPVVDGSRVYVFMPQLLAKTLASDKSMSVFKSAKLETLREYDAADSQPTRTWELSMGWTEFVRGSWSAKRMCSTTLTVEGAELPDVTDFLFEPVFNHNPGQKKLTLLVSHKSKDVTVEASRGKLVGIFFFSEDQMRADADADALLGYVPSRRPLYIEAAADSSSESKKAADGNKSATDGTTKRRRRPLSIAFQKVTAAKLGADDSIASMREGVRKELDELYGKNNEKGGRPVLFVPSALDKVVASAGPARQIQSVSWAMSYSDTTAPLGLALSSQRPDGTSASYFMVPRSEVKGAARWSPGVLDKMTSMTLVDHGFSAALMQKAAPRQDPLKRVFEYLGGKEPQGTWESFGRYDWGPNALQRTERQQVRHHELAQPMSIYDWEIGLHSVLLAVERLYATQQYDEALEVARLVFDPTVDIEVWRPVEVEQKAKEGKKEAAEKDKGTGDQTVAAEPKKEAEKDEGTGDDKAVTKPKKETVTVVQKQNFTSCWRFPPFQDIARRIAEDGKDETLDLDSAMPTDISMALLERQSHGALVHASARGQPQAYMKWIVMKYAEILLASGDAHFRRGTMESLPLATQRYIEAQHVLGPAPLRVPRLVSKQKAKVLKYETYATLSKKEIENELGLPFSAELVRAGAAEAMKEPAGVTGADRGSLGILKTAYFCVPLNPKFRDLRNTVGTRLYNIRNSLDIDGRPVTYALVDPPIDPGALVAMSKAGLGMSAALDALAAEAVGPLPRQRFDALLKRAQDLVSELRSFGDRLVSAIERKEAEALTVLQARDATSVARAVLELKQLGVTEAEETLKSLEHGRKSQVAQLKFHLKLIGEDVTKKVPSAKDEWVDIDQDVDTPTTDDLRMSPYEKSEMDMKLAAGVLGLVAGGLKSLVAPLCAVPKVETNVSPLGVGASVATKGTDWAAAVKGGAAIIEFASNVTKEKGELAARKGALTQQLQQRRLQANTLGREVKATDKQIEIQRLRVQAATKELAMQQEELDGAAQMETWFRTKYTNQQLYGWMETRLRTLYHQAYTLAVSAARRAEQSLSFEQGRSMSVLRSGAGYWDATRDGLLAAEDLWLDLKRLEQLSGEDGPGALEITKAVSLRQIAPLALVDLRHKGTTTFSLTEALFDMDFPGHYMRRLRSVAVSIPTAAAAGPHDGVNATLTLQSHKYRVSPTATTGAEYTGADRSAFRHDRVPISSVAISTGSKDAGVFELSFSGSRYMPFEGAGAVSTWRLDLPTEMPQFDHETIGDVVLHLQYTAQDGGARLRKAAGEAVQDLAKAARAEGAGPDGFWGFWDLRSDFAKEWQDFSDSLLKTRGGTAEGDVGVKLGSLKDRLPFWSRRQPKLAVRSVALASRNAKLAKALSIEGVTDDSGESAAVGDCTMMTWSGLQGVKSMDDWEVKVGGTTVLGDKEDKVEGVYLLVNYVFA